MIASVAEIFSFYFSFFVVFFMIVRSVFYLFIKCFISTQKNEIELIGLVYFHNQTLLQFQSFECVKAFIEIDEPKRVYWVRNKIAV